MFLACFSKTVLSQLNYNHLMLYLIQQAQKEEPFIVLKNYRKSKNIQRKIAIRKRPKQVPPITIKTRRMLATNVKQVSVIHQVLPELLIENHSQEQDFYQTPRRINFEHRAEFQMKEMQYAPLINQSLVFEIENLLGFTGSKVDQDVELLE